MARPKKVGAKKAGAKKTQATAVNAQKAQMQKLKVQLRDAKAALAAMKQEFKAKVANIEGQGIEKGYAKAMKQIGQIVKAKVKAADAIESKFEKDLAKLAGSAKKATPAKKGTKARKATVKRGVAKKVSKKTVRKVGKTMKRAAATKKVNDGAEATAADMAS